MICLVRTFRGQNRRFWTLTSGTPQQQQPRKRSYRPWGCYLRPGNPSSQRERGRRKNLRTVRHRAYGPWYRSYRRKRGQLPCCRDAGYGRCRRRKQRCKFSSLIERRSSIKVGTFIPCSLRYCVQNALLPDINAKKINANVRNTAITPNNKQSIELSPSV